MRKQFWIGVAACASLACISAVAGTWTETGATGRLPSTAQVAVGSGALTGIFGNLTELNEVDMYLIRITDPLGFSASTLDGIFAVPDPQLFLFNYAGYGVYTNDDGGTSQSVLPAGHISGPVTAGLYYLAIARFNNDPLSIAGSIFPSNAIDATGPELPGGAYPITSWSDDVLPIIDFETAYGIELTGAQFIPEPGTMLLCGFGLLAALARRRRH